MSELKQLKEKIKNILLSTPIELVDNDGSIYEVPDWETFEVREYQDIDSEEYLVTRKIGSSNMIDALDFLYRRCRSAVAGRSQVSEEKIVKVTHALFYDFLAELEQEQIIKKTPEARRKEIRLVVDNTVEGLNDEYEDEDDGETA